MRRTLYLVVGIAAVLYGWRHYQHLQLAALDETESGQGPATRRVEQEPVASHYRCDGRVYCAQMHSCQEATWFVQNCAGTKMDGDGDGVPCEKQWCTRR